MTIFICHQACTSHCGANDCQAVHVQLLLCTLNNSHMCNGCHKDQWQALLDMVRVRLKTVAHMYCMHGHSYCKYSWVIPISRHKQ